MSEFDINSDACRGRQRRLIEVMQRLELDLVTAHGLELLTDFSIDLS